MSKLRPILFSTEMVRAILDGRKTQTRRVCRHQHWSHSELVDVNVNGITQKVDRNVSCPYGQPGDILWVRETWCYVMLFHAHDLLEGSRDSNLYVYKTSFHEDWMEYAKEKYGYKWKPSIHMPFAAARIFLRVKNVRVERLQDISERDAVAEGIMNVYIHYYVGDKFVIPKDNPINSFRSLWQSINGSESWEANPWVWVVEFEPISKEEAMQ